MIKLKNIIKEGKFEESVEGIELSIDGMNPSVAANAIVKAIKKSYGSNATKIGLEIKKLLKLR